MIDELDKMTLEQTEGEGEGVLTTWRQFHGHADPRENQRMKKPEAKTV
jgi:hypothetical protein